jgi:hypothetical protein
VCEVVLRSATLQLNGAWESSRNQRERFPRGLIRSEGRSTTDRDIRRTHQAGLTSRKQEQAMKLNSSQVKQTLSQFEAEVLPDDHPAVTQLNDLFGDHTFFLDGGGLKVLEPTEAPEMQAQTGELVSLADWSDASLTSLRPHEPEPTGVVVVLESRH